MCSLPQPCIMILWSHLRKESSQDFHIDKSSCIMKTSNFGLGSSRLNLSRWSNRNLHCLCSATIFKMSSLVKSSMKSKASCYQKKCWIPLWTTSTTAKGMSTLYSNWGLYLAMLPSKWTRTWTAKIQKCRLRKNIRK